MKTRKRTGLVIKRTSAQAAEALGVDEGALNKVLDSLYAVKADLAREHVLTFYGTPSEFAEFKAKLRGMYERKRMTVKSLRI